ncbi:MAG: hypothetical protein R3B45_09900 [Bdellovibrionota bacterium]
MLGVRHYGGFAIDLWQGHYLDFYTDMLGCCVLLPKKLSEAPEDNAQNSGLLATFFPQVKYYTLQETQVEFKEGPQLVHVLTKKEEHMADRHHKRVLVSLTPEREGHISEFFLSQRVLYRIFFSDEARHLAIMIGGNALSADIEDSDYAGKVLNVLKEEINILNKSETDSLKKRVSFILSSDEEYRAFQDALFRNFPEKSK